MSGALSALDRELFDDFAKRLSAAVEGMTGEGASLSWDSLPSAPPDATLRWRQPMSGLGGAVWILSAEPDWTIAGSVVLKGAGIEDAEASEIRSTYLEITNQALAGFGQALTARLQQEVTPEGGEESASNPGAAKWAEVHLRVSGVSFALAVGFEEALLDAVAQASAPGQTMVAAAAANGGNQNTSKTFDLLLDVELPVSVSFGRAQIPLKDVLKLTTGSIVELNRSIAEPVEIIVNNCVIARGEVVVVDGNFGVRIQEVISRQERLRTLQ